MTTRAALLRAVEARLEAHAGQPAPALARTGAELKPSAAPDRIIIIFLDHAAPRDLGILGQADEQVRAGERKKWVRYPSGQGRSKLTLQAARNGTGRKLISVRRLAQMACAGSGPGSRA